MEFFDVKTEGDDISGRTKALWKTSTDCVFNKKISHVGDRQEIKKTAIIFSVNGYNKLK